MNNIKKIVLMYHGIIQEKRDLIPWRKGVESSYDVSLKEFEKQISLVIKEHKDMIITFDDGEENNFVRAYPVIKNLGLQAYFFIIANKIGQEGYMTLRQVQELTNAGMLIGSHSLSHCILTEITDTELHHELKESKDILEKITGSSIDCLSIPRGFCNKRVIRTAIELGYKSIYASDYIPKGFNNCFKRIAVKNNWDIEYFKKAINGQTSINEKLKIFLKSTLSPKIYISLSNSLSKMLSIK